MTTPSTSAQGPDIRREEQLRIQAVGAAISRREWWEVEQAYNAIRDEFDRRPASPSPAASPASPSGDAVHEALREAEAAFETIRVILVNELDEPVRRAFWRAVEARNSLRTLLGFPEPTSLASDATPAPTSGSEDGGDLVSRAEVIRVIRTLGDQDADLALYGAVDNARAREYGEAAATRACCAIALMPTALAKPASEPAGGDVGEAVRWSDRFRRMPTDNRVFENRAGSEDVERGWLIELHGVAPSWAVLNPMDYDEHWTTDSTRAIRFAREADAQAYIDHIGWTEAFPSEHIWDDGRSARTQTAENLIRRIEPYIDAIVCYASTMGGVRAEPHRP